MNNQTDMNFYDGEIAECSTSVPSFVGDQLGQLQAKGLEPDMPKCNEAPCSQIS